MSEGIKRTVYSVAILGESTVGKTKILETYLKRKIDISNIQTIGIEQYKKQIKLENGETISIKFWDTAGQERYRAFAFNIIRQCQGIILVYAINNKNSFNKIKDWVDGIDKYIDRQFTPLILIGNKIDLANERVVSKEDGKNLANTLNANFFETSAVSRDNIDEAFQDIINSTYNSYKNDIKKIGEQLNDLNDSELVNDKKKKKKFC